MEGQSAGLSVDSVCDFLRQIEKNWREREFGKLCRQYASYSVYVTPDGVAYGQNEILHKLNIALPDRSRAGVLILNIRNLRIASGDAPPMASVLLKWTLRADDGMETSGLSNVTLELVGGEILITQDLSF